MQMSIHEFQEQANKSREPVLVRAEERCDNGIIIPAKWVYPDGHRKQRRAIKAKARSDAGRNRAFDAVAPTLHASGYSPVPVSGKVPRIKKWTRDFCDTRPSADDIAGKWGKQTRSRVRFDGVGIACHDGVTFIDIDVDDWQPVYKRLLDIIPHLDECPAIIGRRGMKLMLRAVDGINHRDWNIGLKRTNRVLEVLAYGRQGVIAPSIHPVTGMPYTWRNDAVTPLTMKASDLPVITSEHVEAIRIAFPPAPTKAAVKTRLAGQAASAKQEARKATREAERWNGNPEAMRRCTAALEHLDADSYQDWNIAADAFASWASEAGRPAWDEWSRSSPKFDQAAQDAQWAKSMARAAAGEGSGMGAIIAMAAKHGFDKSLKAWPSLYASRHGNREQHGDSAFEKAVAAMPKGPKFLEALSGQRRIALHADNVTPRDLRLLDWLHGFASEGAGFAWPSEKRLAELTQCNERALSQSMRNLVRAGLIVIGPRGVNPQKLPTDGYAFLPPSEMTWSDVLSWQDKCMAHDV